MNKSSFTLEIDLHFYHLESVTTNEKEMNAVRIFVLGFILILMSISTSDQVMSAHGI